MKPSVRLIGVIADHCLYQHRLHKDRSQVQVLSRRKSSDWSFKLSLFLGDFTSKQTAIIDWEDSYDFTIENGSEFFEIDEAVCRAMNCLLKKAKGDINETS